MRAQVVARTGELIGMGVNGIITHVPKPTRELLS